MMPGPTKTPMVYDQSSYKEKLGSANCEPNDQSYIIDPCQVFNGLLKDFPVVKERLSKIPLDKASNNSSTSTREDSNASSNLHQTCRYYIPKTASQADPNASRTTGSASQPSPSTSELPASATAAFENFDLAAQESEGEAAFEQEPGFEMVEKDEAMGDEDEDDMVVVEEPEEEEDYVEV